MAEIDPVRRAEIGREKRARTRSTLIEAARARIARQALESVTVDDVVKEAGVARGTFYTHFDDLPALIGAVELELVSSVDELLQPVRLSIGEPALRVAFGCACFLDKAIADPAWARIVARMGARTQIGGQTLALHLLEDLKRLSADSAGAVAPKLGLDIVIGLTLWFVGAFGEGSLAASQRDAAIAAILRALGVETRKIASALKRLPPVQRSPRRVKTQSGALRAL